MPRYLLKVDPDLCEIARLDQCPSGGVVKVERPVLVDEVFLPFIKGESLHVTV